MKIDEEEIVFIFVSRILESNGFKSYTRKRVRNDVSLVDLYFLLCEVNFIRSKEKTFTIVGYYSEEEFIRAYNPFGEFNKEEISFDLFKSDMLFKLRSFLRNR